MFQPIYLLKGLAAFVMHFECSIVLSQRFTFGSNIVVTSCSKFFAIFSIFNRQIYVQTFLVQIHCFLMSPTSGEEGCTKCEKGGGLPSAHQRSGIAIAIAIAIDRLLCYWFVLWSIDGNSSIPLAEV